MMMMACSTLVALSKQPTDTEMFVFQNVLSFVGTEYCWIYCKVVHYQMPCFLFILSYFALDATRKQKRRGKNRKHYIYRNTTSLISYEGGEKHGLKFMTLTICYAFSFFSTTSTISNESTFYRALRLTNQRHELIFYLEQIWPSLKKE